MKRKRNGFTLIELIAVLVIMAIIALIATPLVMSIIRKARVSADKRSIDAYGRSIELAIAGYLLDTGKFPTEVSQLTIEYSGSQVECSTTQINTDSSVYLAGCTVAGRSTGGYKYGSDKLPKVYNVGDKVTYNGVDYYVIKNSSESDDTVTLLKAEPLTVDEVNQYGAGHVNRYTYSSQGEAYNCDGNGGTAFYSNETCGYEYGERVSQGCSTEYNQSDIKFIIDSWSSSKVNSNDLVVDSTGYSARLITINELRNNLGYGNDNIDNGNVPSWVKSYNYWTMNSVELSSTYVWAVTHNNLENYFVSGSVMIDITVRPVITIKKSAL